MIEHTNDFKLVWIIFVKESNRNTHDTIIVARDVVHLPDLNSIIIIVCGVVFGRKRFP